jgi:hypothetical protein
MKERGVAAALRRTQSTEGALDTDSQQGCDPRTLAGGQCIFARTGIVLVQAVAIEKRGCGRN